MSIQADHINYYVMELGERLIVTISGNAVEYLLPVPLVQIAAAAAEASGFVVTETPKVETFGSMTRVRVTFSGYTK